MTKYAFVKILVDITDLDKPNFILQFDCRRKPIFDTSQDSLKHISKNKFNSFLPWLSFLDSHG